MPDQPKAPKGMEWYYRPGTTEPELRPRSAKDDAEEERLTEIEEDAESAETEAESTPKPTTKKAASKSAKKR